MHINIKKNHHHEKIAFVLAAAVAVDITTFVSGNSLRDPKTVAVVQKENDRGRGLTTGERRLAVSVLLLSCLMSWLAFRADPLHSSLLQTILACLSFNTLHSSRVKSSIAALVCIYE